MKRIVVGPFNRVEGDLEVSLDLDAGQIAAAYVNSPLYRGFEQILVGRDPLDALAIVPRICGICSVSQSMAAAEALAAAAGIAPTANGRLARNLIHACENVADHLSHFYLFFMPDFARPAYADRPRHAETAARFRAIEGSATADVLPARAAFLRLMGHLAGKWPHTLGLQPGGTTRSLSAAEQVRVRALLREFRAFLETTLFGDTLETVADLDSPAALAAWRRGRQSDFARFLDLADDLGLTGAGRAGDLFLSFGAYPEADGHLLPQGTWLRGDVAPAPLDPARIAEDASHAWLDAGGGPRHPADGRTVPVADKPGGYTWCKAPRYGGRIAEVGALARQLVAGQPLLRSMVAEDGGSVAARVVARLVEIARLVPEMERWVLALVPGDPYCAAAEMPAAASGVGLVEAARGSLGHWLRIEAGRIAAYQIIAPTTWNFSPRDAAGIPGPLEQALAGLPLGPAGEVPPLVQHVVRSFDPCMVCTVH